MRKHTDTLIKSFLAGIMISIGATAYLAVEDKILATFLFTFGLFSIYSLGFYLYTGKAGYITKLKDIRDIVLVWIGNLLGTLVASWLILQTRIDNSYHIVEHAQYYSTVKLGDNNLSSFILAFFCGIMMFIAVENYKATKTKNNNIGGYIGLFLCVILFLILGFEHSIANMFYFSIAGVWSFDTFISLLIVTVGNAVGCLFINVVKLAIKDKNIP